MRKKTVSVTCSSFAFTYYYANVGPPLRADA